MKVCKFLNQYLTTVQILKEPTQGLRKYESLKIFNQNIPFENPQFSKSVTLYEGL